MNVLIACEESQRVCMAFRERGHNAFSCDILDCSGGHPEWHIQMDVTMILGGDCSFCTNDGKIHHLFGPWDLIIAHPPCTYLTVAGAVRMFNHNHTIKDPERFKKMLLAKDFFMMFWNCNCEKVGIENPLPMKIAGLPKYSQIIEPYYFGDPYCKRTCLWLRGLEPLKPVDIVEPIGYWVNASSKSSNKNNPIGKSSQKERSKTFPGIARAMAEQWG